MEHILALIIRTQVDIDAMQFGFMFARGTSDVNFILRQVHEKYLGKHKDLYFAFVDLEKAFDRVSIKVLWWAMKILMSKNVSLELHKLCTQMQNIVYESMVSIALGLMSKLGYIRILSSARFYLPLPLSSTIMPFPDWLSLGTPLCGCPSYHCRDTR